MSQLSFAAFDRQKWKEPVYWLFSDDLMTVLAVLMIPAIGLPMLFQLSPAMLMLLDLLNYFIIAMFIAEYLLKLYVADSRIAFAMDLWHALDLFIILLALVDFLGLFSGGRASPVLRLLRLLRIFTAAGRSVKVPEAPPPVIKAPPLVSKMVVNTMDRHGIDRCTSNGQPCKIIDGEAIAWIDMQDVSPIDLDFISQSIRVPRIVIESKLVEEAFPRIDYYPGYTTIFLWDAKLVSRGESVRDMVISRMGLLIICAGNRIITICTGRSSLFDEISGEGLAADSAEFPIQVLYSILRHKVKDGEEIVRAFEHKTVLLEELPVGKTPPAFLEDTFHLKKDVQKVDKNLWHLRQVLDNLKSRKVALNGITDEHLHLFDILYDEADYLYETAQNINDSLASLRELHINTVSYEMTRVMRILAVITCLALVPSTIGGLLGENILGQPFPLTIGEVMVIVASLMVLELYAFYKMGWLR